MAGGGEKLFYFSESSGMIFLFLAKPDRYDG